MKLVRTWDGGKAGIAVSSTCVVVVPEFRLPRTIPLLQISHPQHVGAPMVLCKWSRGVNGQILIGAVEQASYNTEC